MASLCKTLHLQQQVIYSLQAILNPMANSTNAVTCGELNRRKIGTKYQCINVLVQGPWSDQAWGTFPKPHTHGRAWTKDGAAMPKRAIEMLIYDLTLNLSRVGTVALTHAGVDDGLIDISGLKRDAVPAPD